MPVADDFFILARDENGALRLQERTSRLGLATAILAELVLSGHVEVYDHRIGVTRHTTPPLDAATHTAWDYMRLDRQMTDVRSWLLALAQIATDQVGERLARSGQMQRSEVRRLLRSPVVRWKPANMNTTALPATRLRWAASRLAPVDAADRMLLALLHTTELRPAVLEGLDPQANRYLDELLSSLPPPLYDLACCLGEQLAANAMTYR